MNPWFFLLFFTLSHSASASLPDLKSFIAQKQYVKAVQLGENLIKQNPQSPSALFYTAFAYQNLRQNEPAKKHYLSAIKNNAKLPEIYNNLASIYVVEKEYTKAAETLTQAINAQPNMATVYSNLSKIYRHLASKAYQQVLNDGTRQKIKTSNINPQLLADLSVTETLKPIQLAVVKKPKPVIRTTPIKSVTHQQTDPNAQAAQQAIINWANAWQSKNVEAYINSYADSYAPKSLSHDEWVKQRHQRINRPGDLFVAVDNFDIRLFASKISVRFDQTYRSSTYQDKVRKRMHLQFINNEWRIISEVTVSVL